MSQNKRTGMACAERTGRERYLTTLAEQMPQMTHLFELLDAGSTPNFLDMINAISEMVAFYTDSDQIPDELLAELKEMSQNKCLFCS